MDVWPVEAPHLQRWRSAHWQGVSCLLLLPMCANHVAEKKGKKGSRFSVIIEEASQGGSLELESHHVAISAGTPSHNATQLVSPMHSAT